MIRSYQHVLARLNRLKANKWDLHRQERAQNVNLKRSERISGRSTRQAYRGVGDIDSMRKMAREHQCEYVQRD